MICLVSIIIPIYNAQKYIEQLITNLDNQNNTNFEVIFVDDGSNDNSYELLCEFVNKSNFIHKIIKIEHSGVSAARNIGIKNSSYELIYFADCDDIYKKDLISNIIENFSEDMLVFNYKKIDASNDIELYYSNMKKSTLTNIEVLRKLFELEGIKGYLWNKVFKKSTIIDNNIWFNENLCFCEDLLFVSEYINKIKNVKIEEFYGYDYFIYPERKSYVKNYKNIFDSFDKIFEIIKDRKTYKMVVFQDFNWVRFYSKEEIVDRAFLKNRVKKYYKYLSLTDKIKFFYFVIKKRL